MVKSDIHWHFVAQRIHNQNPEKQNWLREIIITLKAYQYHLLSKAIHIPPFRHPLKIWSPNPVLHHTPNHANIP